MRIALVAPAFHKQGGTERCMTEIAEQLAARGHTLVLFASSFDEQVVRGAARCRVPTLPRPALARYLSFLVMNSLARAWVWWRTGRRFDVVHSTGPDVLRPTVTTLHCCAAAMAEATARESPTGWRRAARLRRWTNTMTYHLIGLLELRVVKDWAARPVTVSRSLAVEMGEYYRAPPSRVTIIPNGVNLDEFHPQARSSRNQVLAELGVGGDPTLVLFVGYNWKRKGLSTLVDALESVLGRESDIVPLLLVVGGRGQPDYEQTIARRLRGQVRFLGTHADMTRVYGASDICVLPSDEEPFGLPILEAMACRVPGIVSRRAGVAELITDGVDGLLLDDPHDSRELATKLSALVTSPELRVEMGVRARQTAEKYPWAEIARRVEAVYLETQAP